MSRGSRAIRISIARVSNATIIEKLREHYKFLEHLQWSIWTILVIFVIIFVFLHVMAYRDYRMRKKRVLRDQVVLRIDEKEGGDAEYLVSIMTSRDYDKPTTAVTTVHLIGRVLPGRVHDIGQAKIEYGLTTFAPLSLEKIVFKEDMNIDPIVGIVIKTNQAGRAPTWNCKSIIVRNLGTNEAWFFKVKSEIGFSRMISPSEPKSLVTLNHCVVRRLRQEWRNGQHVFFGMYFWDRMCVYSKGQRIFVSIAIYLIHVSFTMMGLSITMPYSLSWTGLKSQMNIFLQEVTGVRRNYGVSSFGLSLEGETHMSVWFHQMLPSAFLAAFISTMLGFVLVTQFREREKYEIGFSDMDYVIGTALRKLSNDKRISRERAEAIAAKAKTNKTPKSSSKSLASQLPPREAIFEPAPQDPLPTVPSALLRKMKPLDARAMQRYLFIGGEYMKDPRYANFAQPPALKNDQVDLDDPDSLPDEMDNYTEGSRDSADDHFYSEVAYFDSKMDESQVEFSYDRLSRQIEKYLEQEPPIQLPSYVDKSNQEYTESMEILPGEKNPDTYARSCYKPPTAWTTSLAILFISLVGFAVMTLNGPAACIHPGLFTMIFLTTVIIGLFIQIFVFENIKVFLVSFFYAYNDWILYKIVQEKMLIPPNVGFQYRL